MFFDLAIQKTDTNMQNNNINCFSSDEVCDPTTPAEPRSVYPSSLPININANRAAWLRDEEKIKARVTTKDSTTVAENDKCQKQTGDATFLNTNDVHSSNNVPNYDDSLVESSSKANASGNKETTRPLPTDINDASIAKKDKTQRGLSAPHRSQDVSLADKNFKGPSSHRNRLLKRSFASSISSASSQSSIEPRPQETMPVRSLKRGRVSPSETIRDSMGEGIVGSQLSSSYQSADDLAEAAGWGWFVDGAPSPSLHMQPNFSSAKPSYHAAAPSLEDSAGSSSRKVARRSHGSSPSRHSPQINQSSLQAAAGIATMKSSSRRIGENSSPNTSSQELAKLAESSVPAVACTNSAAGSPKKYTSVPRADCNRKLSANNSFLDLWTTNLRVDSSVDLSSQNINMQVKCKPPLLDENAAGKAGHHAKLQAPISKVPLKEGNLRRNDSSYTNVSGNSDELNRVESFSFNFEM